MADSGGRGDAGWVLWLTRLSLKQVSMLAAGIVVLASGVFGGLEKADIRRIPVAGQLTVGVERHAHPIDITIEGAEVTTRINRLYDEPDGHYLVIVATISADVDESLYEGTVADIVRIEDVPGVGPLDGDPAEDSETVKPRVFVDPDGSNLAPAVPGLTYRVRFVWEQSASVPAPSSLTVITRDLTHRKSTLDTQMLWTDPTLDARGRIPVREVTP